MSRRDDLHNPVRRALEKDGWTITHDPLTLHFRGADLKADLGAEKVLAAEKEGRMIAVEIKDFDSGSPTTELERVVGQLQFYQGALDEEQPERELFLAVSEGVYNELFIRPLFLYAVERNKIDLLVFNEVQEVILQWIRQ